MSLLSGETGIIHTTANLNYFSWFKAVMLDSAILDSDESNSEINHTNSNST